MRLGLGRAEESFPGFSFVWSLVWVSLARPAHLRQCKLGMYGVFSYPWGTSAGELLLAEPLWPCLFPRFLLAGLRGGQRQRRL